MAPERLQSGEFREVGEGDQSFEQRLVETKLISAHVLHQATKEQKISGHKLGEWLVEIGIIDQREYLKFVAQELNTRFVSAQKLAALKVDQKVIDMVPVRLAESASACPVAFDSERGVLSVVMVEPRDQSAREELAKSSGAKQIDALVAMRSAIRAVIKKLYYGDNEAFTADGEPVLPPFRCPECTAPANEYDFQCARCELLLNPAAVHVQPSEFEPSVVRYLLAAPEVTPSALIPEAVKEGNENIGPPLEPTDVLRLVPGVDVGMTPLHKFEAFVACFVDGKQTIREVAKSADLDEKRVVLVCRSLAARSILEKAPAEAPQEDPAQTYLQDAIILERQGNLEEAVVVLKAGAARSKNPAQLYNRIALILVMLQRELDQAEELLSKAIELDPKNPVYQRNYLRVTTLKAKVDMTQPNLKAPPGR